MAKSTTRWICSDCGAGASGWFGKCPACGAWNTIEQRDETPVDRVVLSTGATAPVRADQAPPEVARLRCGLAEVDRVFGGGLVRGSVGLLGGAPGIGKSTLLLQVSAGLARSTGTVLYASGEESTPQIAGRAQRLGAAVPQLLLVAETRVEAILEAARELAIAGELAALVVDSIQTVYSDAAEGLPGNVSQIRACAAQLVSFAKLHDIPVVVVGHVTKDGQLAGPRVLEHLVDVVLSFEGDDERALRLLRASKNRFGSTAELGVFEMTGGGLREIGNPSEAFLAERPSRVAGSCITATLEGSRPLLLEVQALLAPAHGGARRNCVGVDPARVAMLLAVLERHAGLPVLDQDVFVNVAGGMRIVEPAADLAIALAVASSHLRRPIDAGLVALGEIGLTGEIRQAQRLEPRLAEARRLGFERAVIPPLPAKFEGKRTVLKLSQVRSIADAVAAAIDG
ncbi:MAG: DNA repair protein RadA [Deltaproteobacteria bacterium]|nr:DNA repair protein RadA [Deltaproteobacteria bacterium]MBK8714614.1 DNA repair protein RadA [Deltaproteobacteria bacterium]MBP7292216.1 DNA repair protein RadA [Nannocystaceae bacterium]